MVEIRDVGKVKYIDVVNTKGVRREFERNKNSSRFSEGEREAERERVAERRFKRRFQIWD